MEKVCYKLYDWKMESFNLKNTGYAKEKFNYLARFINVIYVAFKNECVSITLIIQ